MDTKSITNWWNSRIRVLGKGTYVRLTPNPGFRLACKGFEIKWSRFYGLHIGRAK